MIVFIYKIYHHTSGNNMFLRPANFIENTITVDLEMSNLCQLKCPYCEVWQHAKNNPILWTKKQIDNLFEDFSKCKHNIVPILLGGEPTIHPQINHILDLCKEIENIPFTLLVTNAVKDLSHIRYNDKVKIVASYHTGITNTEDWFNNLSQPEVLKHLDRVMFLLTPKYKQYKKEIYDRIHKLKPSCVIEPRPLFLVETEKYLDNFLDDDIGLLDDIIINENKKCSFYDIIRQNKNHFLGWQCMKYHIQITCDGEIVECPADYINRPNIFKDKHFFENYTLTYSPCKFNECLEDCFVQNPKYDVQSNRI